MLSRSVQFFNSSYSTCQKNFQNGSVWFPCTTQLIYHYFLCHFVVFCVVPLHSVLFAFSRHHSGSCSFVERHLFWWINSVSTLTSDVQALWAGEGGHEWTRRRSMLQPQDATGNQLAKPRY